MGLKCTYNGNELIDVQVVLDQSRSRKAVNENYIYQNVTKREFENFSDSKKELFVDYVHNHFRDMTVCQLIRTFGFEPISKEGRQISKIAKKFDMPTGKPSQAAKECLSNFEKSGIVIPERNIRAKELIDNTPVFSSIPKRVESQKADIEEHVESDCSIPAGPIFNLVFTGEINKMLELILDLDLEGEYEITLQKK